jgi:hypothetical protein
LKFSRKKRRRPERPNLDGSQQYERAVVGNQQIKGLNELDFCFEKLGDVLRDLKLVLDQLRALSRKASLIQVINEPDTANSLEKLFILSVS